MVGNFLLPLQMPLLHYYWHLLYPYRHFGESASGKKLFLPSDDIVLILLCLQHSGPVVLLLHLSPTLGYGYFLPFLFLFYSSHHGLRIREINVEIHDSATYSQALQQTPFLHCACFLVTWWCTTSLLLLFSRACS